MKTNDIIDAGYKSFHSLIDVVERKISDDVAHDKLRGILEGRHTAFTVASSQLNIIKDLELSINEFNESNFKKKAKLLLGSTKTIMKEILKALTRSIDISEEAEDEKFKNIVMSKKVAFDFLLEINNTQEEMNFQLENVDFSGAKKTNLATLRVKKDGNK